MENVHILWAYKPENMHCAILHMLLLQSKAIQLHEKPCRAPWKHDLYKEAVDSLDSIVLDSSPLQRQNEDYFLLRNREASLVIIENLWG